VSEIFAVTERLVLRDYRPADVPLYVALSADPEVMRYLGGPRPAAECEAELAAISKQYAAIGYGMLAVEHRADGAFLGICGLSVEHWYPDDLQIGWRLFPAYWGRGYAREAALVWRDHAFSRNIARLISISDVPNARSHRLMQRLGMRLDHTATLSDDRETFEAHVYALTRQEWLSLGKL
jgi:RimJ/RimL family protein N-acetyltransferase